MSELMTFSLSNKKSRHERYAVRDDVVEYVGVLFIYNENK